MFQISNLFENSPSIFSLEISIRNLNKMASVCPMLTDPDKRTLLVFLAFSVGFLLLLSRIGQKVNRPPITKI